MLEAIAKVALKIFSYFDLAKVVLGIISTQLKPVVTDFIDGLMAAWQEVIDVLPEGEEKEDKKKQAHADVVMQTQKEFSQSPSYIPSWVIDIYIKSKLAVIRNRDKDASDKAREKGLMVNPESVDEYVENMRKLGLG